MSERRPLTRLHLAAIGVNAVVGSSIFLFPGLLMAQLGPASIVAFLLTAALLVPVALGVAVFAAAAAFG